MRWIKALLFPFLLLEKNRQIWRKVFATSLCCDKISLFDYGRSSARSIFSGTNVLEGRRNTYNEYLRFSCTGLFEKDVPAFNVGDTVKVHVKIKEGNRERIQIFEGFVLKRQNGGIAETFTVRRIASGVGVEKTFPVHSPWVEKIEVVRRGDVRRARLHYMRGRTGKAAKIKSLEK